MTSLLIVAALTTLRKILFNRGDDPRDIVSRTRRRRAVNMIFTMLTTPMTVTKKDGDNNDNDDDGDNNNWNGEADDGIYNHSSY